MKEETKLLKTRNAKGLILYWNIQILGRVIEDQKLALSVLEESFNRK